MKVSILCVGAMANRLDSSGSEDVSFIEEKSTGSKDFDARNPRISKEKGRELSKSILESMNAEKNDLSEEHSDYEEEIRKDRHKKGIYSSDENDENVEDEKKENSGKKR